MFNNLLPKSEKGNIMVLFLVFLAVAAVIAIVIYHTGSGSVAGVINSIP